MDLEAFGQQLRQLRTAAGLNQAELAKKLAVSSELISRWERAYCHRGRYWKPDRQSVVQLIEIFADQLTPAAAQAWANLAGYRVRPADLPHIFSQSPGQLPRELPLLPNFYVNRRQEEKVILDRLQQSNDQVLVLLGPGGTGKSTLAAWTAQRLVDTYVDGVIWTDAHLGDTHSVQDSIAGSLGVTLRGNSLVDRAGELRSLLRDKRCLLILDDVWAEPDLVHLRVTSPASRLLVTSRDAKVADVLGAPFIRIGGLTQAEGLVLLAAWVGQAVDADWLVTRFDGLPLALSLSGAQLRAGVRLADLLKLFASDRANLSVLDMDDPQATAESLNLCFDVGYNRLPLATQQRLAQLGCFEGNFDEGSAAAIWGIDPTEAPQILRRLIRFAMLEQTAQGYRLHPLLRDYALQKLTGWPAIEQKARERHATWYIRYALYHPGVLDDVPGPAPNLDHAWLDVVAGVKWAAVNEPNLAAKAALLAHTERPALLRQVGPALVEAVVTHLPHSDHPAEQAILHDLAGELHLLAQQFTAGLDHFSQAATWWVAAGKPIAASRAILRVAGTHLLQQDFAAAASAARQAQVHLAQALPVPLDHLEAARWLFYWFDMVYNPLIRWPDLPEADVAALADLARQTGQPILEARGLHIHRLWCTTQAAPRSAEVQQRGCELAIRAYALWRACGQRDKADDEVSWSRYLLKGRYTWRTAARFARRRSQTTPVVSPAQIQLIDNESIRWWLGAGEAQRVGWLSRMLPRYLGTTHNPARPLPKHSRAWRWVDDILSIGTLGSAARRLVMDYQPPPDHPLNGPEWQVLSGQKVLPLVGPTATRLVAACLAKLESRLDL